MTAMNLAMPALLFSVLSSSVNAASIDIDTRGFNGHTNGNDLVTAWNNQTSAINTNSVAEFNFYSPGINTINRLTAEFSMGSAGTWGFEAGLDAHYGAELYLDGSLIGERVDDLWWAHNWANSDVLRAPNHSIAAGTHSLALYWAESCCNGSSSMRFTTDGSNWQSLATANLDAASPAVLAAPAAVAEPLIVWLTGLSFAAFMLNHRKQKALTA